MPITRALRADALHWKASQAHIERDALLLIDDQNTILDIGEHATVMRKLDLTQQAHVKQIIQHFPGKMIAPGFIDCHAHYPQIDVIGSPADGLLPWLNNYTFPHEARFSEPDYAANVAKFYFDELARHGVTCALTFSTSHVESVTAAFTEAQKRGLRFITGKCLMDRNCPDGVRDSTQESLIQSEELIKQWHEKPGTRLGYAITPRFAPSCSDAQMYGAAELAKQFPSTWIQSHVAENTEEIAWAKSIFPKARSYLQVYADFGLMRERAVYAHCIHLDDTDRRLLVDTQTAAAVCPTSNLFLGSGAFDFQAAHTSHHLFGLASDIGGGTSLSPFKTMLAAYFVARSKGYSLSPSQLWHQHTLGAARALGLEKHIGNLAIGSEADIILLDPQATPMLARKVAMANSVDELLFAMIVLGDERLVASHLFHQIAQAAMPSE
jgi:guanine deaminase